MKAVIFSILYVHVWYNGPTEYLIQRPVHAHYRLIHVGGSSKKGTLCVINGLRIIRVKVCGIIKSIIERQMVTRAKRAAEIFRCGRARRTKKQKHIRKLRGGGGGAQNTPAHA